jgi:hypothetical protein
VIGPRVLREYALVADGERGALIGPDGAVTRRAGPAGPQRYRGRRVNTAVTRDPPGPAVTFIWSASSRVSHRP